MIHLPRYDVQSCFSWSFLCINLLLHENDDTLVALAQVKEHLRRHNWTTWNSLLTSCTTVTIFEPSNPLHMFKTLVAWPIAESVKELYPLNLQDGLALPHPRLWDLLVPNWSSTPTTSPWRTSITSGLLRRSATSSTFPEATELGRCKFSGKKIWPCYSCRGFFTHSLSFTIASRLGIHF